MKSILIAGATGLVGSHLLKMVLNDNSFSEIIVLTRRPVNFPGNHTAAKQYIVDFSKPDTYKHFVSSENVVCALGTTIKKAGSQEKFKEVDFTYSLNFAAAASENNCSNFILVSAVGSNPDSKIFYNKIKGELERELQKLNFKSIHILHPSLLLGDRKEFRFGEKISQIIFPAVDFLVPDKYRAIKAETVALKIKELALKDISGIHHYEGKDLHPGK